MSVETVEAQVRKILVEQLSIEDPFSVEMHTKLDENLNGYDSLDLVEICMAIEEDFGFEIPDEDTDKWATVGDVVRYVEGKAESPKLKH